MINNNDKNKSTPEQVSEETNEQHAIENHSGNHDDDDDCPKTAAKKPTSVLLQPILLALFGVLLMLSIINQIYTFVTWDSKIQCYGNNPTGDSKVLVNFVMLTSWVLWMSTAFYIWYVRQWWWGQPKTTASSSNKTSSSWAIRCFFQIVLCFSTVTIIAFTAGLVTAPPQELDDNMCIGAGGPRVNKSQPHAMFWLVMDWIFNVTAHYLCGLVLIVGVYCRGEPVPYDIATPVAFLAAVPFTTVLALVHTFVSPVYDNTNIWLSGLSACLGILVLHGLFYYGHQRCLAKKKSPSAATHSNKDDKCVTDDDEGDTGLDLEPGSDSEHSVV